MSEEVVPRRFNPDYSTYLAGGVGVMALIGLALWYRYDGSQAFVADVARSGESSASHESSNLAPLGTPGLDFDQQFLATATPNLGGPEDIFERIYFGYSVYCGMLNTDRYGHDETVDPDEAIFHSAEAIFGAMGERVDHSNTVMVVKGPELLFRDSESGDEYSVDANGTVYCETAQ